MLFFLAFRIPPGGVPVTMQRVLVGAWRACVPILAYFVQRYNKLSKRITKMGKFYYFVPSHGPIWRQCARQRAPTCYVFWSKSLSSETCEIAARKHVFTPQVSDLQRVSRGLNNVCVSRCGLKAQQLPNPGVGCKPKGLSPHIRA